MTTETALANPVTNWLLPIHHTVKVSSPAITPGSLLVSRLSGTETLGEPYCYTLQLRTPDEMNLGYLSPAANLPLPPMVGKAISVSMQLAGGGERHISGLVSAARVAGHQGRGVLYELQIEPWLVLLQRTSDYRIFQNKTVVDIIDAVLADYPYPVEKRLIATYPPRAFQVQYGETDFQFLQRLMEEWGIYYHFEHGPDSHTLVLQDAIGTHKACPDAPLVPFHQEGLKLDEEFIHTLSTTETLRSGKWVMDDFDFTRPKARLGNTVSMPRETGHADGERYEWPGDYFDKGEGELLTTVRMEAQRSLGYRSTGSGNIRTLLTGNTFTLSGCHTESANREYLIISTVFSIEESARESGQEQHFGYSTGFELQPTSEMFRLQRNTDKPRTRGPQSAIVTGPAGEEIWTDKYGRVKVQFLWDRYGQWDENSSCWVRVSQAWAGQQFGGTHIPRIGQEVIVDFKNGDPDLPIIMGRTWNSDNMPDWQLPSQQALSGLRSKEIGGRNANKLILDDTPAQIQAVLGSDHLGSQLSLGYLTHIPANPGRTEKSGEGAALRTDGHASIRAGQGLHLSTWAKPAHSGSHLDNPETRNLLQDASQQLLEHNSIAVQQQADELAARDGNQALLKALSGQATAEYTRPVITLSSPAGIVSATPANTHIVSGEHTTLTSGAHLNVSAGRSLVASVVDRISLFVQKLGFKLIAMHGDILIDAQSDNITIRAKKKITLHADEIAILASTKTTLNGGGSYETLSAGAYTHYTNGPWTAHGASHTMQGPANAPEPPLPDVPPTQERLQFALTTHPEGGQPYALHGYTLYRNGSQAEQGVTDQQGRIFIENHQTGDNYRVKLDNGAEYDVPVQAAFAAGSADTPTAEPYHSSLGYRQTPGAANRLSGYPQPIFDKDNH